MARFLASCLLLFAAAAPLAAQLCAPAPGIEIPRAYAEYRRLHPDSHRFERAWRGRLPQRGDSANVEKTAVGSGVAGHFEVPLFLLSFADSGPPPYDPALLEQKLFDGPTDQTVRGYYLEISNGSLDLDGNAYGWHSLPYESSYYTGTSYGTVPGNARLGELMRDTFESYDAAIDFGQYDNDGPDGIPNSGDDDGYVDFVAFVHPDAGGECGGSGNIWSHRWRYSSWPASAGSPFVTGDASASGGPILIDDYTIQPALACGGASAVEIGIFCHEIGHAFGLPDLYDIDGGGGAGLGHWCLMASGNWNKPSSPAHMSAWAKQRLGWVSTVVVDWQGTPLTIEPVGELPIVYELPLIEDRWQRRQDCAIHGAASLSVGLDPTEASTRGWTGIGYGNGWRETVARDFHYDGQGPVMLSYDYSIDSEAAFDFLFVLLTQDGIEKTIAVHSGRNAKRVAHEFSMKLEPGDYRISFRFVSDRAYSTEDGGYASLCMPVVLDDIALSGGGEGHYATFEEHGEGWYSPANQHDNPTRERWLIENRQFGGFDQHLHAAGLMLYHVDDEVIGSALGNSGGTDNAHTRGIVVEEADGQDDLLRPGGGRGNSGDAWPQGAATSFDLESYPNSYTNSGHASGVRLESMAELGKAVSVYAWAGRPAPAFEAVQPAVIDASEGEQWIELLAANDIQYGATLRLQAIGQPTVHATAIEWNDSEHVRAHIDFLHMQTDVYDVVLVNPDGQSTVRVGGVYVNGDPTILPQLPPQLALYQNAPNPFNPSTTIRFDLPSEERVRLTVLDLRGRVVRELLDRRLPAGSHDRRWDGLDERGRPVASGLYFYRLENSAGSQERKMMLLR